MMYNIQIQYTASTEASTTGACYIDFFDFKMLSLPALQHHCQELTTQVVNPC